MKKLFYFLFIITIDIFSSGIAFSANEQFRSIASGSWNSTSTWEMSTNSGSTWIEATSPPSDTSGIITVRSPNVVTVTADVTANQLTVNDGATLAVDSGINLILTEGTGDELTLLPNSILNGPGTVKTQGTAALNIRNLSQFNADLIINTGTTTANDQTSPSIGRFYGNVTVDSGATLTVGISASRSLEYYGTLTNNGTITATGSNNFNRIKGPSFVNNGSVAGMNLSFDTTSTLSGAGSFSPSNDIIFNSNANVTLLSDVAFSPTDDCILNTGAALNLNSFILNFIAGTFVINNGSTLSGPGTFKTQGTVSLNLRDGSNFNAPLNVSSGATTANDQTSPLIGRLYGNVTVDAGATLTTGISSSRSLEYYGTLTNNGTITATGSNNFNRIKGPSFVNNGSVAGMNLSFDTTSTVSGAGSFSTTNDIVFNSNANVTLLSDITFSPTDDCILNTGAALNLNSFILNFTAGTFVINNGGTISGAGIFKTQNNVALNLRNGSNFNAPLNVSSGTTTANDQTNPLIGRLYGNVTVDAGATLTTGISSSRSLEYYGTLTNNGTITAIGSNNFNRIKGPSFVNNGSVAGMNLSFDTISALSGAGSFSLTNDIVFNSNANVTLLSDVTFSPTDDCILNTGAALNLNSFILNFIAGTFVINNSSTLAGPGIFKTQNTVALNLRDGSNFNAPLNVSSGITTANDQTNPLIGRLYGNVTVDIGATLTTGILANRSLEYYGSLTNDGTLAGSGSANTMRLFGPTFTNNGNVTVSVFNFETGAHTLQGIGFWSTRAFILSGSITTLGSEHQMQEVTINTGGTFDITSRTLKLSGGGIPITNNGTFITSLSTIEYNGSAVQSAAAQTAAVINVEYYSISINNSAGVTLGAAKTIPGILSLSDGVFTTGANLTMGDGAKIIRKDGSLSNAPTFGATIDVFYIGENQTNTSVELPASTTVLRDLSIDNTGGVSLADARTVNRILYLSNGIFDNSSNLTMADNITIDKNVGNLNSLPVFPASVNVIYSGVADFVLTGLELPTSNTILKKLIVEKTGGILLTEDITVNDSLRIKSGYLDLNGKVITMGQTAYLTETPGNTVRGTPGYLIATRDLNSPNSENVAGLGAVFTTSENMGTTEIKRGHRIQTEGGTESIARYYDIHPANNTSLDATFVFKFDESELNGNEENNLVLFRSTDDGITWVLRYGMVFPSQNEIVLSNVNEFSKWTAGDSITSLPVELTSFTSVINQRDVTLSWTTSQELNNSGFEIERLKVENQMPNEWSKIAFVQGNGTTSSPNNYSYTDKGLSSGKYNYRLKQVDINGNYEYHNLVNEIEIGIPDRYSISQNYPNPFNPTTKIDYSIPSNVKGQTSNVKLVIYNSLGREIYTLVNENQTPGIYSVEWDGANYSSGVYFYRLTAGDYSEIKKMTLVK